MKMPPSIDVVATSITGNESLALRQDFWNANLPQSKWTKNCPDFLIGQGPKNIGILSGKQENYHVLTWEESKTFVGTF